MTKTEFAILYAQKLGVPLPRAERILNAALDSIEDALALDGRIALPGFGIFDVRKSAARQARNPSTQEAVYVEERNTPRFRPSLMLRRLLE